MRTLSVCHLLRNAITQRQHKGQGHCSYGAVSGVGVGVLAEQEAHNVRVALHAGHVQRDLTL